MALDNGEEKLANICAFGFSALSMLFMLVATIGASTMFTPSNEQSQMSELSMLRWHPAGALQYFFGLTRVVAQRREENEDYSGDDIGDDEVDDEFNWYFNVYEYKDCKDTGNALMTAEVCKDCNEAGLKTKDLLISICVLFAIVRFAVPMLIMLLPMSALKQQVSSEPYTAASLGFPRLHSLGVCLPLHSYYILSTSYLTLTPTLSLVLTASAHRFHR